MSGLKPSENNTLKEEPNGPDVISGNIEIKMEDTPPETDENTEDHIIDATNTKEDTMDENTAKDILKIMTMNAIFSTSKEEKMPDPTTAPLTPFNSAVRSIKNNLKDIDEIKNFRKKKAFIREGAILPNIIRSVSYTHLTLPTICSV